MALSSGKIIATFFDKAVEQLNKNTLLGKMVEVDTIDTSTAQNASDVYWRNVEQQAPLLEGRDLTGQITDVIEQTYPLTIEDPKNDYFGLNTSELRDEGFMERRVRAAVSKLNTDLENRIMKVATQQGSIYYETPSTDFDFVAEADTIMTERQLYDGEGRSFLLSPRDNQQVAGNLASRTLYPDNRSEYAYDTALVGQNVAGFDVYRNMYAGTITGNTASTTTTATLNFKPEGAVVTGVDTKTNTDYRTADIPVTASASFNVGDVIEMGTNAVTMNDKVDTGELMTFKVVAIPDGTTLRVFPKPIAWEQRPVTQGGNGALTAAEAAYANVDGEVASGATINTVNTTAGTKKVSSFMANDAICVVNGSEPLELLNEFGGMKVDKATLDNGVDLYIAYDATVSSLNTEIRLFTRYGVTAKDPSRIGNVRLI